MKLWYVRIGHVPVCDGKDEGDPIWWAHGKNDSAIGEEDVSESWITRNGFKTIAAAKREGQKIFRRLRYERHWRSVMSDPVAVNIPDCDLRYKIYKCYEIVILDRDGNEVGNVNYCYGTKADAEDMAKHELKLAMMEEGC